MGRIPAEIEFKLQDVTLRCAGANDLPGMEWEGEYRHFRRLYRELLAAQQQGRAVLWVAETQGKLVGQLFVQLQSGRAELADGQTRGYFYGFRVRPVYRNQGIGSALMDVAEQHLIQQGFRWLTLNVGRDNPGARRFYERRGYRVIAAESGRWSYLDEEGRRHEVIEPAWRMQKHLLA